MGRHRRRKITGRGLGLDLKRNAGGRNGMARTKICSPHGGDVGPVGLALDGRCRSSLEEIISSHTKSRSRPQTTLAIGGEPGPIVLGNAADTLASVTPLVLVAKHHGIGSAVGHGADER